MRIQNNIAANNALRKLTINQVNTAKNLEKLSSGFQINNASDNAAGLAISEKMKSQINGLEQAEQNVGDAISLIQTAEGGLNETHSMLQRIRELTVQAANGIYVEKDRDSIKAEITQITEEIDAISEKTEFNGMKLLNSTPGSSVTSVIPAPTISYGWKTGDPIPVYHITGGGVGMGCINNSYSFKTSAVITGATNNALQVFLPYGSTYNDNLAIPDGTSAEGVATIMAAKLGEYSDLAGFTINAVGDTVTLVANNDGQMDISNIKFLPGTGTVGGDITELSDTGTPIDYSTIAYNIELDDPSLEGSVVTVDDKTFELRTAATMGSAKPGNIVIEIGATTQDTAANIENALKVIGFPILVSTDFRKFNLLGKVDTETTEGTGSFEFQIGANSNDTISLSIDNMGASSLGINNIKIDTSADASDSITILDLAINKVSEQRANLGAIQNRLEHTINNLSVSSENLISSESKIRDTDMAKEMMEFTKNNILSQAAQSMLAQANQQPQGILQLLS